MGRAATSAHRALPVLATASFCTARNARPDDREPTAMPTAISEIAAAPQRERAAQHCGMWRLFRLVKLMRLRTRP